MRCPPPRSLRPRLLAVQLAGGAAPAWRPRRGSRTSLAGRAAALVVLAALTLVACRDEQRAAGRASPAAAAEPGAKPGVARYTAGRAALVARFGESPLPQGPPRAARGALPPGEVPAAAEDPAVPPAEELAAAAESAPAASGSEPESTGAATDAVAATEIAHPAAVEQPADDAGGGGGRSRAVYSGTVGDATVRFR